MRGARNLDPIEIRILGSLLEKQQTTPEYYPLSFNALLNACNQKTNREPVTELSAAELSAALERLHDEVLVWKVHGARVVHFDHNLDRKWELDAPQKALITLLLLRGDQTAGELRSRSERMFQFASVGEVESHLRLMSEEPSPLVRELPRRPGQKESRWRHLAASETVVDDEPVSQAPVAGGESLSSRVSRLEEELAAMRQELDDLKAKLGE